MISRIIKAALIAWVGKKLLSRNSHAADEVADAKPVSRQSGPARKASTKRAAPKPRAARA